MLRYGCAASQHRARNMHPGSTGPRHRRSELLVHIASRGLGDRLVWGRGARLVGEQHQLLIVLTRGRCYKLMTHHATYGSPRSLSS